MKEYVISKQNEFRARRQTEGANVIDKKHNDIGSLSLSPRSKLILFADDILPLHPLQSSSDLSLIQSDLNSITSWLSLNLLSVNPAKSKYMIFALKSQQCFELFSLLYEQVTAIIFSRAVSVIESLSTSLIS